MSVYLDLTREFNAGRTRAILTSGQSPGRQALPLPCRWREAWPSVEREVDGLPLDRAHARVVERALGVLPFEVAGGRP